MSDQVLESWFSSDAVTVVFQPIFHINRSVSLFAVEALTRGPAGTDLEDASALFEHLRNTKQEMRADRFCIEHAVRIAGLRDDAPTVALNVHPTTLEQDGGFAEFLAATLARERIDPRRVILEIVEDTRTWSARAVIPTIRELRSEGIRIALDDVGIGLWNYRTIAELAPNLLKVDRHLVDRSAVDGSRRAVLRSVCQLAAEIGASIVAEGIEREDDLAVVCDAGIHYGQGFLFSHPRPLSEVLEQPRIHRTTPIKETRVCSERRFFSSTTPTPSS